MTKGRIVCVDDDLELTRLLQISLEDEGYEVLVANEGEEGLGTILEAQPDLVILDVMMPGLNGWELAKYLREREEWANTPILMLTGIGSKLNDITAPLYGANAHLDKPFDMDELIVQVELLFEGLTLKER